MSGHAIVVGGGIGGLATVLALRRIGWRATVLERAPELGEVGAGMSQAPNALRALAELGVEAEARAVGVPTYSAGNLRTPDGRYLQRALPGDPTPLLAFHRADLHGVLLDAVPAGWLHTAAEVTDVRQAGDGVTVTAGGSDYRGDLVIGADGIRSAVRARIWPEARAPRHLGRTAWLGVADVAGLPGDLSGSVTMGRDGLFLIHPVSRGRAYWALLTRERVSGVRYDDERAAALDRVGGWHDPVPQLVRATPDRAVIRTDIRELPPPASYVRGRVALLGDAAHAMSPDRGQGAGHTLEDAVVLAHALSAEPGVEHALARYDAERRPRDRATARGARIDGAMTSSRLGSPALATLVRLMPAALWRKGLEPDGNPTWRWVPPRLPMGPPER
ncbi:FAD-dependent monooxygenase [Promicromonospora iranensis]|uniref:FAD-dependent monooxygenase n=1 Tax=Promicromonospora iranensis TaxID=1105144 RepID=UPI0023A981BE|nr:FAD-dependent monooxygenase [Promicromonospora iranensis]